MRDASGAARRRAHAPPAGIAIVAPGGAPLRVRRFAPHDRVCRDGGDPSQGVVGAIFRKLAPPGCMSGATTSATANCGSTRRPACPRWPTT